MKRVAIILIALLALPMAWADSIVIDGERLEGVYIHQTERMVLVHFPRDGSVQAFTRDELGNDAIELAEDDAVRDALRDQWRLARDARRAAEDAADGVRRFPIPHAQLVRTQQIVWAQLEAPQSTGRETALPVSDGIVPRVDLRDIPLGTALKAMLRPMGLDFEVREGMVYISDPETIRTESWESLETRVYDIKNFDATLPKIVVMNPGGQRFLERGGVPQGGFGPAFPGATP